ncbi:MFS transporter [Microtetraspora sp. NBRC 13810]|uniref:MFS transporter n=1 Tax=Microtetraspora sp. NBRC 13810 TaxID=3030990 RepID=UPI0024A3A016|nr:MFS transporter [Microtetraspora sp. NBRC 13810]GLW07774.1 MFS transporter [Microtetraspora sp. NBRC 13810]
MVVRRALVDVTPLRSSPAFRRLWIGGVFSGFGSQMALVAVMFQVWEMTGSTVWTGAVGLAQAIPLVVFGLFAGSIIDRTDRRTFYLIATTGQAVCAALLAVQGFFGPLPVGGVLALVAAQSCFVAGGGPAARTFIPRLLPRSQVAAGLALNRISFQAAMLAGPALGGLILGWLGVAACYLIDAISFGLAFYGAFGLPPMRPEGEPARPGLQGVLDGLGFLARSRPVRGALLTDLAATVLSMPVSLFPLINAERFGGDPRTLGLFLSAIAVGGVISSVFSGAFTRLPRPGLVMLAGSASWGVTLALFGLSANPWLGLACLALAGAADTLAVVSRSTIVQLHTPDALLGRVSAAEQIVGQAGPDVGNMRGGLVAGATSGTAALVSGGLLCVAAVVAISVTAPELRRSGTAGHEEPRAGTARRPRAGSDLPPAGGQP